MTKQNKDDQIAGEDQISELVHSSGYEQELEEKALSETSGAGFGTAQHGKYIAELYGGNGIAQAKSYVHGLFTVDSKNGSYKTYNYALEQAKKYSK